MPRNTHRCGDSPSKKSFRSSNEAPLLPSTFPKPDEWEFPLLYLPLPAPGTASPHAALEPEKRPLGGSLPLTHGLRSARPGNCLPPSSCPVFFLLFSICELARYEARSSERPGGSCGHAAACARRQISAST